MAGPGSAPWHQFLDRAESLPLLIWLIGIKAFLLVHLPIMLLAASVGVWLFYVQHQFEQTTWDEHADWDRASGRAARQLALRPARHPALVHGQHRHAPCPSSVQPHPLLPAAARAARSSGAARHRPADAAAKLSLRAARAVGRDRAPPGVVSRGADVNSLHRITGAAMLSIITLMQAGLPLASARSIAPGRSAARSTYSPWPPSAATARS